jgi:hypothetical protein
MSSGKDRRVSNWTFVYRIDFAKDHAALSRTSKLSHVRYTLVSAKFFHWMQTYMEKTLQNRLLELVFFNLMDMSKEVVERNPLDSSEIVNLYEKRSKARILLSRNLYRLYTS